MEKTCNKNYEKAMETLKNFLAVEFPEYQFTKEEKDFLVRYKIIKEETEKDILIDILGKSTFTTVTDYYAAHTHVKKAKVQLQNLYNRFSSLCERESDAFGGFIGFLEWWYEKMDGQGEHHCYYCDVEESVSETVFEDKKITSKKFTGGLQIDRKDPDKGYNKENCVFACVLCNNAKSDMISAEDYKNYFGKATKAFWEHISDAN